MGIKVRQVFFCDEVSEDSFGKINITGMLPSRKISINEVPYFFKSNVVVDCLIDPGEYQSEVCLNITDLDSGISNKFLLFGLNGTVQKTDRLIRWSYVNVIIHKYVSIKVSILMDDNMELYSEIFEFRNGSSPNFMFDIPNKTLNTINSSGLLGSNLIINVPEILVKLAHKEVILIDQYLTAEYLTSLLPYTRLEAKILILTGEQSRHSFENFNISSFSNPIEIKFMPQVRELERFHDRFIILNGSEVYHLGYSLKDLGKQISRYSKVTKKNEVDDIIASFNTIWSTANPL